MLSSNWNHNSKDNQKEITEDSKLIWYTVEVDKKIFAKYTTSIVSNGKSNKQLKSVCGVTVYKENNRIEISNINFEIKKELYWFTKYNSNIK